MIITYVPVLDCYECSIGGGLFLRITPEDAIEDKEKGLSHWLNAN